MYPEGGEHRREYQQNPENQPDISGQGGFPSGSGAPDRNGDATPD